MPTYEYVCEACGNEFEKFQSMSAAPVKVCPSCGKKKVIRKIGTGAGIIFKGGGFYETDYRNESYKKAAEAEKSGGESKAESKTAETKSESKPDAKSETAKPAETKAESPAPAAEKPAAAKPVSSKSAAKPKK